MVRTDFLAMKTDQPVMDQANYEVLNSDMQELKNAAKKFANHAMKLGGLGFGTSFLQWLAAIAAIYLLVLDRTNWKTNMLTSLLIPYIFFTLPSFLFSFLRGEIGKWIAFVFVVIQLFFPQHFKAWFELPGALFLLLVVAPDFFANTVRGSWAGIAICLVIGCYLLHEHIKASGGFKEAFTKPHGYSNTIGILLLFVYPVWSLVLFIL